MKKSFWITLTICLVLILALLSTTVACPKTTEAKTLNIGFLASLTGFASSAEIAMPYGAQIVADMYNEDGGITVNGQQYLVNFIVEDHKSTVDGTTTAATKLVYDDQVKFIAGSVMNYITEAEGVVTEPAGVLRSLAYNVGTPTEYGAQTPFAFVSLSATIEGHSAGQKYLTEAYPEAKTIALVMIDDGSIPYVAPKLIATAQEYGLNVVGDPIGWTSDTVDFTPVAQKALALNPDAIEMVNGWPMALGSILKAAREKGFTGPAFPAHNNANEFAEVAGKDASTNWFNAGCVHLGEPSNYPVLEEIGTRMVEKYGDSYYYGYFGAESAWVLLKAIEAAQSLDPAVVRDTWENMETIESIFGPAPMGGQETYGINHTVCTPLCIDELVNGEAKFVKWVEVYSP